MKLAGEGADLVEEMLVVDAVERRRQVRVQDPLTVRVFPVHRLVDRPDRVVTATAGPESVGLRGSNRASHSGSNALSDPGLEHPVDDHGNPEWPAASPSLWE